MKKLILAAAALLFSGCYTHHTIVLEQPKPLEININFNGHLDLVIQDARQNLEQINGGKPTNVVRPEDIGLPPTGAAGAPGAAGSRMEPPVRFEDESGLTVPVMWRGRSGDTAGATVPVAAMDDLKKSLQARHEQVQALWDGKLVGESHTGFLEVRGTLNAAQQKVMTEENADRKALYAAEAKTKGISETDEALSYYIARLGYAKKGAWYEKMNAATKQWEWKEWGS